MLHCINLGIALYDRFVGRMKSAWKLGHTIVALLRQAGGLQSFCDHYFMLESANSELADLLKKSRADEFHLMDEITRLESALSKEQAAARIQQTYGYQADFTADNVCENLPEVA